MAPVIESAATVGIPSSIGSYGRPRSGVVVHYVGSSHVSRGSHASCRAQVRGWHSYHRNGNGWAGLGYHFCVCHHGIVMTGRGLNRVGAHAPGANASHVGVLIMLGGSQRPTANQLKGFREFRSWLGRKGVRSSNVTPHSRWISTSCPGNHLRSRVSSNSWGAGGTIPSTGGSSGGGASTEDDEMSLINLRKGDGKKNGRREHVIALQGLILKAGGSLPEYGTDGDYGDETAEGLRKVRKSVGSAAKKGWGNRVSGHAYAQLMQAVAKRQD
ncbi:peptidoglycan recognition protein family protein [Streptomonospora wellingtoniae]|uniref:Peptidoglycan recognition family protein n=1 Tax=Streptomonospora wellingtoniae TaxID=3075544 RepID=A0ABU2KUP7_9ACTN|nr:peptidoglycan recognition family protein [Streptomonospora sp. DSM 45055]MDT0302887.1 peptidoglycan recognition family protein [Streptomonospora sp. DSM 45055]